MNLICTNLNNIKLVLLENNGSNIYQRIRLNVSQDDVQYALRDSDKWSSSPDIPAVTDQPVFHPLLLSLSFLLHSAVQNLFNDNICAITLSIYKEPWRLLGVYGSVVVRAL